MGIRIVRLGSPRADGEGIRIGTVRRPPRGVRKEDYARLNYYDTWLPQLAPSAELLAWVKGRGDLAANWREFERRFRRELSAPDNQRLLDFLTALSRQTNLSLGCFCEDERVCHRSILRKELARRGAEFV